jgi:hypothetical protein
LPVTSSFSLKELDPILCLDALIDVLTHLRLVRQKAGMLFLKKFVHTLLLLMRARHHQKFAPSPAPPGAEGDAMQVPHTTYNTRNHQPDTEYSHRIQNTLTEHRIVPTPPRYRIQPPNTGDTHAGTTLETQRMTLDTRHLTHNTRHRTPNARRTTLDTQHLTPDA